MRLVALCLLLILVVAAGQAGGRVSLAVSPNILQVFPYDRLSLYCKDQGGNSSSGWGVTRGVFTRRTARLCGTDWGELVGSNCTIKKVLPRDSGLYWCQSEAGEKSESVDISVTCGNVVLESPVLAVNEGDEVNLRCWYNKIGISFPASFYKDGTLIRVTSAGHMTIPSVSKSDEGLYKCSFTNLGESSQSWLAVRGPGIKPNTVLSPDDRVPTLRPLVSVGRLFCHLAVITPYCISTALMVLIYRGGPGRKHVTLQRDWPH